MSLNVPIKVRKCRSVRIRSELPLALSSRTSEVRCAERDVTVELRRWTSCLLLSRAANVAQPSEVADRRSTRVDSVKGTSLMDA